jgi:hypothetical protein
VSYGIYKGISYGNLNWITNIDEIKARSVYVLTFGGGIVSWKFLK